MDDDDRATRFHHSSKMFLMARVEAARKKPNPALARMRFEIFDEGLCAQIMHIGPYSAEKPTIDLLHQAIAANGYKRRGRHHEIYLGDPRKSAPEKLKNHHPPTG